MTDQGERPAGGRRPSAATRLVQIAVEVYEVHRTADIRDAGGGGVSEGHIYAVLRDDPSRRYELADIRPVIAQMHELRHGSVPSRTALADAMTVLKGKARQAEPDEAAADPAAELLAAHGITPDTGTGDAAAAYYTEDGCTWWAWASRDGVIPVMLATFEAEITEEVTLDDGTERTLIWLVQVTARDGRTGKVRITPDQLGRPQAWAARAAGTSALVMPGQWVADHLRVAVQSRSQPQRRTIYAHTGWRELGGHRAYLTASGAMNADGLDPSVTVNLGTLSGYELPPETGQASLQEAVQAGLGLFDLAPDTVMVPVLAAAWRAPLPIPADCGVWLYGRTGSFKTELTALAQQHYGRSMDAKHLPGHWTATGNALVTQANMLDAALFVVDDYSPDATAADARRRADAADRLLRGTANRAGRARLRPDGTLRPDRVPRAQVLTSAEDTPPPVESLIARTLIIDVAPGAVDVSMLTDAQARAADGVYATAMAGYIRHLAARWDDDPALPEHLVAVRDELRAQARADGQHPRTSGNVASLALGCLEWLAYARQAGAVDEDEQQELWQRCRKALEAAGAEQDRYLHDGDPVRLYLRALRALIASGRAHLADATMRGGMPAEAARWGWAEGLAVGEPLWRPQGELIGWVVGDDVYLQPDAAYRAARQWADAAGSRLGVSERTLHRDLRDRGLLATTDGPHLTVRRDLSGQRQRRVLHLSTRTIGGAP